VWNTEGSGRLLKFRALYQGDNVAEVFNSAWAGKTMDDVVPMSLRRVTLDAAKECVRSGCLVYTIVSTIDSNDRRVDCERLLLPFGRDGSKVEQILAFLQLRNMDGGARRRKILRNFELHADLVYSCKIQSGFTRSTALETSPNLKKRARPSRRNILRAGKINFANGSVTCTVRNISATGALIEVATATETPKTFTLILEMETTERPCTIVWRKRAQIGVRFT
jgi:PilZ domain